MDPIRPGTPEALAAALRECSERRQTIYLYGAGSKERMAGPLPEHGAKLTTCALRRVLQYEPQDLTISVEAGLPWQELTSILEQNRQMVPIDPPFTDRATVGGVVAANTNGPRRRLYGTVRDAVIGMKFATLEGKLVQSGGMVVKNVAGLDMAKLMIGSFGTLAAIAVVNFKVVPMPLATRTFSLTDSGAGPVFAARDALLGGVLQPAAVDVLNPAAAEECGLEPDWTLLVQAAGSRAVLDRYAKELPSFRIIEEHREPELWCAIREFTPAWLARYPDGGVIRYSETITGVHRRMQTIEHPAIARAANGVVYAYLRDIDGEYTGTGSVIEYAPANVRRDRVLWPEPGSDFEMMSRVKDLFDPHHLLNPGRMYGRI